MTHPLTRALLTLVVVAAALSVSCAQRHHRKPTTLVPNALPAQEDADALYCDERASPDRMLVDLPPEALLDLERAIGRGVVFVVASCKSLRVLPDCSGPEHADYSYGYAGSNLQDRVISIRTTAELNAALPMATERFTPSIAAGRTITIGLVTVGELTMRTRTMGTTDLVGNCLQATHFVQRATLGAFAITNNEIRRIGSIDDVFLGGISPATPRDVQVLRGGSLDACRTATPLGKPPADCQLPITVTLMPIHRDEPTRR